MALVRPLKWSWKAGNIGVPDGLLEDAMLDFLIDLDEAALAHDPDDLLALHRLGESYTRRGRHAEGLAIDRRIVKLQPTDDTAHYNLACSLALTGDIEGAFASLEDAITHGYDNAAHLAADEDLDALHDDPRWEPLVERVRSL